MDQSIVVVVAVVAIAVIGGRILWRKKKYLASSEEAIANGRYTTGRILAVKKQTGFDRERGRHNIRLYLEYDDPETDEKHVVKHVIDQHTPNVPHSIKGAGSGAVSLGAIKAAHAEAKEHHASLVANGYSEDQARQEMMDRAVEQARNSTGGLGGEADAEGYLPLKERVDVDVYLYDSKELVNDLHIVFRK